MVKKVNKKTAQDVIDLGKSGNDPELMADDSLGPALGNMASLDNVIAQADRAESLGGLGAIPGNPDRVDPPKIDTTAMLAGLLTPLFLLLAPGWKVSNDECQALAGAWCPVIDKYFPGMDLGVELSAVLVTAAIFAPRIGVPMKEELKQAA